MFGVLLVLAMNGMTDRLTALSGVSISPDLRYVDSIDAEGGIERLQMSDGKILWRTKDASWPVADVGDSIVALANTPAKKLVLCTLSAAKGKLIKKSKLLDLPWWASTTLSYFDDFPMNNRFALESQTSGSVHMRWEAAYLPRRGIRPSPHEMSYYAAGWINYFPASGKLGQSYDGRRLGIQTGIRPGHLSTGDGLHILNEIVRGSIDLVIVSKVNRAPESRTVPLCLQRIDASTGAVIWSVDIGNDLIPVRPM